MDRRIFSEKTCGSFVLLILLFLLLVPVATADPVERVQTLNDDEDGVDGIGGVRFVAVSPDGANVYGAGEGDSAVAVFKRDAANGRLTFVEQEIDGVDGVDGIEGADALVVSPDGNHVYVAGAFEGGLAAFERAPATGELTFLEALFNDVGDVTGMGAPVGMTISPDGNFIYVSGFMTDSIAVFSRDPATGLLEFVEAQFNDMGGVTDLAGPFGLEVSSDGDHLYIACFGASAVVIFDRDLVTGALIFNQSHTGDPGLNFVRDVSVSGDGDFLYTAGFSGSEIGVFGRDAMTGGLTFIEAPKQGVDGVTGLARPASTALSPDGTALYSVDAVGNALAVFDRDAATGTLDFVEAQFNNMGAGTNFETPLWVTVSPDSQHIYAAAFTGSAVTVFYTGIFADSFESGNTDAWTTTTP